MAIIKDKMIESISASKIAPDDNNQMISLTQKQLHELIKAVANELVVSSAIVPEKAGTDIGSPDKRFRAIYVDEAYLAAHTLYVDGVAVISSQRETMEFKADPDQGMLIKTTGLGASRVTSENTTEISASGVNGAVEVKAIGSNGQVNVKSATQVNISAPDTNITGNTTVKDLTVQGLLKILGQSVVIDSETVTVKDNIIEINKDDVGSGVSKGMAGLKVLRGDAAPYYIVFDESDDLFKLGSIDGLQVVATRTYVDEQINAAKVELKTYIDEQIKAVKPTFEQM